MSARKSERVLNLLIALLTTKRFLTKHEIRDMVEGYRDVADFERTFERDKAALRALGVRIQTGSNDRDLDEEDGYRVDRREYELPEIEFTRDELVAIGLASRAWQTTVGAEATSAALRRLSAAGASPDPDLLPDVRAQIPATEPSFDTIHAALLERRRVQFDYHGRQRTVEPWHLAQRRGLWTLTGHDVDREAPRRFKLSRIEGPARAVGAANAFTIPDDAATRAGEATVETSAVVALRDAPDIAAHAEPVEWTGTLPEGFRAHRITGFNEQVLVTDCVAAGPEAIMLDPPHLREAVVAQLERIAGGAA